MLGLSGQGLGVNKCQGVSCCTDLKAGVTSVCETFRILCECYDSNYHWYDCIARDLKQQAIFSALIFISSNEIMVV